MNVSYAEETLNFSNEVPKVLLVDYCKKLCS